MVDTRLAQAFRGAGVDYHRYRPGFPTAAARAIIPRPVDTVLDLGAGTGKFTAELLGRARRVIAVDPSTAMLAVLRSILPRVDARLGEAERIPVEDSSVDVVTVAQAFHWFDREPACAEIRRVLGPGGILGLLWNHADRECTWDAACHRVAHPGAGRVEDAPVEQLPGFTFEAFTTHRWGEIITREDYIRRWYTVSTFLAADRLTRARMTADVERVLDADAATRGHTAFRLPHVTDVFVYRRDD